VQVVQHFQTKPSIYIL